MIKILSEIFFPVLSSYYSPREFCKIPPAIHADGDMLVYKHGELHEDAQPCQIYRARFG